MRSSFVLVVGLILHSLCAHRLIAQVDQENWRPDLIRGGHFVGSVGYTNFNRDTEQEFTPTNGTLDSVQLWIPFGPGAQNGGSSAVQIRQGVGGPILAASRPTYVEQGYFGAVGYGFTQPVQLVPGQVYTLEPFGMGTDPNPPCFAWTYSLYPRGRLFFSGEATTLSLVFREGVGLPVVPEPSTCVLLGVAASMMSGLKLLARRYGRMG